MTNVLQNEYSPDYVSPPGETLLETLEAIGMAQMELAKRMGRPTKTINEIIKGKVAITAETALQLEQVLNIPASFWLKLEQYYQEYLARQAEKQKLENWVEWLKEIPLKLMIKRGWISHCTTKTEQVLEALKFFGVASPDAWRAMWEGTGVVYRKSSALQGNFGAVAAWLRQGELEAQAIDCAPYNEQTFREVLSDIRTLTLQPVSFFQEELVRLCASAGVAVVFVQELPNTGISGVTRWLTPTKALIQLSLRYKTDDQLWFTFFHEAGHILCHGKRRVFLEWDRKDKQEDEMQADKFACDTLIIPEQWQDFLKKGSYRSKAVIKAFSQAIGIAPGIVVGRLQHESLLSFRNCNELKCYLKWEIHEEETTSDLLI